MSAMIRTGNARPGGGDCGGFFQWFRVEPPPGHFPKNISRNQEISK